MRHHVPILRNGEVMKRDNCFRAKATSVGMAAMTARSGNHFRCRPIADIDASYLTQRHEMNVLS